MVVGVARERGDLEHYVDNGRNATRRIERQATVHNVRLERRAVGLCLLASRPIHAPFAFVSDIHLSTMLRFLTRGSKRHSIRQWLVGRQWRGWRAGGHRSVGHRSAGGGSERRWWMNGVGERGVPKTCATTGVSNEYQPPATQRNGESLRYLGAPDEPSWSCGVAAVEAVVVLALGAAGTAVAVVVVALGVVAAGTAVAVVVVVLAVVGLVGTAAVAVGVAVVGSVEVVDSYTHENRTAGTADRR